MVRAHSPNAGYSSRYVHPRCLRRSRFPVISLKSSETVESHAHDDFRPRSLIRSRGEVVRGGERPHDGHQLTWGRIASADTDRRLFNLLP